MVEPKNSRWQARQKALVALVAACFALPEVHANPVGPQVVNGQASIVANGSTLSVTNTPGAVINWQGFSIQANETTKFIQQSAASSVLNRVVTADPSVILGALQSNGRVFLINPAGILVGAGARIDVGAFVASTLNLSNADFIAGKHNFQAQPGAGNVINKGNIATPVGGYVYLIGPNVANEGLIRTPQGETILAAGNSVRLIDTGSPGVSVEITASNNKAENLGSIIAESGRVGIVGAVVRNKGIISANQLVKGADGKIFLSATKTATVEQGSRISADGERGGKIEVSAQQGEVRVETNSSITAIGSNGTGGTINLQSAQGNVTVEPGAVVNASGTSGGNVAVSAAQGQVQLVGTIAASGQRLGQAQVSRTPLVVANISRAAAIPSSDATETVLLATIYEDAQGTGISGQGGNVQLLGFLVNAPTALIDVAGDAGGRIGVNARGDLVIGDGAKLDASGGKGGQVYIESSEGKTLVSGNIFANGDRDNGGKVRLLGEKVALFGRGRIEVRGRTGGGEALVGGDYQGKNDDVRNAEFTFVGSEASIAADATETGDGGKVIIWSNQATRYYGTITARGGDAGGDGGFAEASGKNYLTFRGKVDLRAPYGEVGTLLLDPTDITIQATGPTTVELNTAGDPDVFQDTTAPTNSCVLTTADLVAALVNSNVEVTTTSAAGGNGDITVADDIAYTTATARTLTLTAERDIVFNANSNLTSTGAALNVILNANSDVSGGGAVVMNTGSSIVSNGGTITISGTGRGTAGVFINGVTIDSAIVSAGSGALSVTGTGTAGAVASGSGVLIKGGSSVVSSGALTLTGTGGGTSNGVGVVIDTGPNVEVTGSSALTITGTGANNAGAGNRGVAITGAGALVRTSGAGSIVISGIAQDGNNNGVDLENGSVNNGGGSGNIAITGTRSVSGMAVNATSTAMNIGGGPGSVTIDGNTGAINLAQAAISTTSTSAGAVTIRDASTVNLGNITANGGGSSLVLGVSGDITGNVTQQASTAISVSNLTVNTGSGGNVTLNNGGNNVTGSASFTTTNGTVSIVDTNNLSIGASAVGGNLTATAAGFLDVTSTLTATGAAAIVLQGVNLDLGASAAVSSTGGNITLNYTTGSLSKQPGATVSGANITLIGDSMNLTGTDSITATTRATIKPYSAPATINTIQLGGSPGGGILRVSQTDMDAINSPVLQIGDSTQAWNINVETGAAITRTDGGSNTLSLVTLGAISQSAAGPLTVTNLRAEGSGVNLVDTANIIGTFAAKSNSSSINVRSGSGTLTIATVDGQAGIDSKTVVDVNNTAGGGIILAANIQSESSISFTGPADVKLSADVTIDSNADNAGASGNINLAAFNFSAIGANNRVLTLDASSVSGNAGQIFIGGANNAGGNYLNILIADIGATGGSAGKLVLHGDVLLDKKGLIGGDAAVFQVSGGGIVSIEPATSVTIDTEQGNTGYGGAVHFGTSQVSGQSGAKQLFIRTNTSAANLGGGQVDVALVSNGNGAYLNTFDVDTQGGAGGQNGLILLYGDIHSEVGDIRLQGPVQLQASVLLKTGHTASPAGNVVGSK